MKKLETKLAKVRTSIREAAKSVGNLTFVHEDPDYVPQGPIYRNVNAFHRYVYITSKIISPILCLLINLVSLN